MEKKEKFILFVALGAIARDLSKGTHDSQTITLSASRIPISKIPPNPMNAAKIFVRHADGDCSPHRWMRPVLAP